MKNQTYDVDYFIQKFKAIPEEKWMTDDLGYPETPRCANGHFCDGRMYTPIMGELRKVFLPLINKITCIKWHITDNYLNPDKDEHRNYSRIAEQINNGNTVEYQQPTPKQRVLAALYDIKKAQQPVHPKEVYIYQFVNKGLTVDVLLEEKRFMPSEN